MMSGMLLKENNIYTIIGSFFIFCFIFIPLCCFSNSYLRLFGDGLTAKLTPYTKTHIMQMKQEGPFFFKLGICAKNICTDPFRKKIF